VYTKNQVISMINLTFMLKVV